MWLTISISEVEQTLTGPNLSHIVNRTWMHPGKQRCLRTSEITPSQQNTFLSSHHFPTMWQSPECISSLLPISPLPAVFPSCCLDCISSCSCSFERVGPLFEGGLGPLLVLWGYFWLCSRNDAKRIIFYFEGLKQYYGPSAICKANSLQPSFHGFDERSCTFFTIEVTKTDHYLCDISSWLPSSP